MRARNQSISVLRVLALCCILMHHSMCMYWGWPPTDFEWGELHSFPFEGLISSSLKLFGLTTFTFLSGFCLYYQRDKSSTYGHFLWNKVKRLLIPCLLFAFLYWLVFPTMMFDNSPINGTHLWYIPMIFCCIILTSIQTFKPKLWWIPIVAYFALVKLQAFVQYRTLWEIIQYYPIFYFGYLTNLFLNRGNEIVQNLKSSQSSTYSIIVCGALVLLIPVYCKVVRRFTFNSETIAVSGLLIFIYITLSRIRMDTWGGAGKYSHDAQQT